MQRRRFLGSCLATAGGFLRAPIGHTQSNLGEYAPLLARRLTRGMKVGVVAPSSAPFEQEVVRFALDIVESLGFVAVPGEHLFKRKGYLAGEDAQRAEDFNTMFARSDIDAVFCIRGGYGAMRILPSIDYDTIAANPKVLMGYSDVTALLNAVQRTTGLITFHGPMAHAPFTDYAYGSFESVLMSHQRSLNLAAPPPFETAPGKVERDNRLHTIAGGKASGHLVGGNLSLVAATLGTPYEALLDGAVLALEDVDESPYRIDRMLTHLMLAGLFERINGIVLGKFTDSEADGPSLSLGSVFADRLGQLGLPVLRGLMIGHVPDQATVPIGAKVVLDADAQTLTTAGPYLV